MNWRKTLLGIGLAVATSALLAQDSTSYTKKTTVQNPDGSMTTTITGEVMQYEPGRTIVIRQPKGDVTYTLEPSLLVPADVQVGRRVTITTEPGAGALRIQRITTVTQTSSAPGEPVVESSQTSQSQASSTQTTTETTQSTVSQPAEQQTMTTTSKSTTIYGTVTAYEPGQSITIVGPSKKTAVYTITQESQLPQDLAVGKRVTVQTTVVSGKPAVRSVTYKTTTKTTHTRSVSPQ